MLFGILGLLLYSFFNEIMQGVKFGFNLCIGLIFLSMGLYDQGRGRIFEGSFSQFLCIFSGLKKRRIFLFI